MLTAILSGPIGALQISPAASGQGRSGLGRTLKAKFVHKQLDGVFIGRPARAEDGDRQVASESARLLLNGENATIANGDHATAVGILAGGMAQHPKDVMYGKRVGLGVGNNALDLGPGAVVDDEPADLHSSSTRDRGSSWCLARSCGRPQPDSRYRRI